MPKHQTPGLFHHFVRTTPRLQAVVKVKLGNATFKKWDANAAGQLAESLRRRSVFARHSAERELYSGKALLFRDRTAMEITFAPGHASDADAIRETADHYERLIFLTEACWRDRAHVHRALGVSVHDHGDEAVDLLMEADLHHVSTLTRRPHRKDGLRIDGATGKRALRVGFTPAVVETLVGAATAIAKRAQHALHWLEQSRLEPNMEAALVKTSIGFETLFVLSDNEPLRKVISERLAFLLGGTSTQRAAIAALFTKFYDYRSAVVHGGSRRSRPVDLNVADRLLLLACTSIAFHSPRLNSTDDMRTWFEGMRWATSDPVPEVPFARAEIRRIVPG